MTGLDCHVQAARAECSKCQLCLPSPAAGVIIRRGVTRAHLKCRHDQDIQFQVNQLLDSSSYLLRRYVYLAIDISVLV